MGFARCSPSFPLTSSARRAAYRLFQADPARPGLHFKQVNAFPLMYSARVGISYRALCTRDGDTVVWFWIGSHAEYDHLLAQL